MHRKKTSTALWNAWQTTLGVCWKRRRQSRGAEHDIGPGYLFSIPKPVASTWSLNYIVFHPSWRLIDPGYGKIVVDCCLEMVIQQPRALPCCVNRVNGPVSVRLASSDILWYVLMLFIRWFGWKPWSSHDEWEPNFGAFLQLFRQFRGSC